MTVNERIEKVKAQLGATPLNEWDRLFEKAMNEAVADERETCAKLCDEENIGEVIEDEYIQGDCKSCAAAIRARGI